MPMVARQVQVGTMAAEFPLLYLEALGDNATPHNAVGFLHLVRSDSMRIARATMATDHEAYAYYRALSLNLRRFKRLLDRAEIRYDAVLAGPSSRQDIDPYLSLAKATRFFAKDLSSGFARIDPAIRAGHLSDPEQYAKNLRFSTQEQLSELQSVLIVDDCYSNGTTVGALLLHLFRNGVRRDVEITVACALWAHPEAVQPTAEEQGAIADVISVDPSGEEHDSLPPRT